MIRAYSVNQAIMFDDEQVAEPVADEAVAEAPVEEATPEVAE